MTRLPTVGGGGFLWMCNQCDYQRLVEEESPPREESSPEVDDPHRFRRLIADAGTSENPDAWPEELLQELPPEAREALEKKGAPTKSDTSDSEIPGHVKRTLMDYGFAIDEDARGVRLRSPGGLRRPGTGDLSPSDVVRLASQLGGSAPPPEERRTCPSCKAVVPRTATRCSWCDADLPPLESPD
jgi:hypothetical protein